MGACMAQTTVGTSTKHGVETAGQTPAWRSAYRLTPYAFLALPVALYCIWVIGPMFYSVWMSFTNSDGISRQEFIGLDNYERLFQDNIFWTSFYNNIRWLVAFITIPIACGLGLALILNNDLPGTRFFKAGFFSPMVVSTVVIGGGPLSVGVVVGVLLCAAGAGRLYVEARR